MFVYKTCVGPLHCGLDGCVVGWMCGEKRMRCRSREEKLISHLHGLMGGEMEQGEGASLDDNQRYQWVKILIHL